MATTLAPTRVRETTATATAPAPARSPRSEPRRRPPLEVVRPTPRRSRIGLIGVVGTLALFAILFALVLFQTLVVQNQARLDRLDSQIRDQQAHYQQLRLQVAQLEAPSRIVEVATDKLGMVPPPGTSYLTPSATDAAASLSAPTATGATGANADAATSAASTEAPPDGSGSDWPTVKPYLGAAR